MKSIVTIALKDLRVLSRDWFGLFWIVAFPLVYALFFGAVFSGANTAQSRAMRVALIDEENSDGSRDFLRRLKDKGAALQVENMPLDDAVEAVRKGKLVALIVVKSGFQQGGNPFAGDPRRVEIAIDPGRKAEGEMLKGLLMEAMFGDLQELFTDPVKGRELAQKSLKDIDKIPGLDAKQKAGFEGFFKSLDQFLRDMPDGSKQDAQSREWVKIDVRDVSADSGGPRSSMEISFPQSILWAILGAVTTFAVSLVLERTQGTLLRLRTAPITRAQLLAGKGLGCFLTCAGVTVVLLGVGAGVLGLRLGNPLHLALAIVCTAFCFTGIMMFLSTLGTTEQGVAGAGWGILMPFAMLGGAMIPLFVMPAWMQTASNVSPIKWGIYSLEGAIWRGFSTAEMLLPCAILLAIGAVSFFVGVWAFQRREL